MVARRKGLLRGRGGAPAFGGGGVIVLKAKMAARNIRAVQAVRDQPMRFESGPDSALTMRMPTARRAAVRTRTWPSRRHRGWPRARRAPRENGMDMPTM